MNSLKSAIIYILTGSILIEFHAIADSIPSTIIAFFGCYIFYLGCQKMLIRGDQVWNKGVSYLATSLYVLVISIFIDIIPLMGFIATLGFATSFVLQVFGILQMRKSRMSMGDVKSGLNFIILGLAFAFAASFFNLIPFFGDFITAYLACVFFILFTLGWLRVFDSLSLDDPKA